MKILFLKLLTKEKIMYILNMCLCHKEKAMRIIEDNNLPMERENVIIIQTTQPWEFIKKS